MKKNRFILLGAGTIIAALALWGYLAGRKESAQEQERERPVVATSRVVAGEDGTAIVFDADARKRVDIAVAAVQATARRGEIEALATVLPAQELIDLRNAYAATKAQADKAMATMEASRRDYERIKVLHADDRNVSDKVLEAAEAAWRGDAAVARAARDALDAVERGARQKWSATLAAAVADDAALFRDVVEQREVLLRVAASSGSRVTQPPATIRVVTSDGGFRMARLISSSPQADPRIQGPTFFYIAPAAGLLPGTTLTAYLLVGPEQTGAIVPADAVVWWQGKAWVYLQSASDRFVRRELLAAIAIDQGWFVPGEFKGAHLVVRGAQALLSEELRAQIQVGEEGK